MATTSLGSLALARLFDLAIKEGKPIVTAEVLQQVRAILNDRVDNAAQNDERDGWTWDEVKDPSNDYAGDSRAKRIDNMIFLLGKSLPGKVTDFVRDATSPTITPALRAIQSDAWTATDLAQRVADALYDMAETLAESA